MKTKLVAIILTALITLSGSITAFAAPEAVNIDGVWVSFDAEYYAANNPDVVAAVGTDANALLQHYITSGQYEGRFCCAPMRQIGTAKILNFVCSISPSRLKKVICYKADGTVMRTIDDIAYDNRGNLIQMDGTIYEYDRYGNLIKEISGGITQEYDGQGNLTRKEYFMSKAYGWAIFADNIYDNTGKLVERVSHEGHDGNDIYRSKYTYDEEGKLIGMYSGYDGSGTDYVEVRKYDAMGKLISIGKKVDMEGLPFPGFDKDFEVSMKTNYYYDELGREIGTDTVGYEYDNRGNIVRMNCKEKSYYPGQWYEYIYE